MDEILLNARKEMLLEFISDKGYKPVKVKGLAMIFNVPKYERNDFNEVVNSLISEGKISIDVKGLIRKNASDSLVGIYSGTSKGFGFVTVENEPDDIFIGPEDTLNAFDKDKVLISIKSEARAGKRREGKVIQILERAVSKLVGTYQRNKSYGFVIPDNQRFGADVFIPKDASKSAANGQKVEVIITDYGNKFKSPEGKVVEILGNINDPSTDIISIVKAYDIPVEFPEEVASFANSLPDCVTEADKLGRKDLRDVLMVTIDGEDAKDLDDAVSLTEDNGVYHLGVHIADVSHYIKENSSIDKEALKRGTSNYLVDSVIPMLPRELSNGLCSLNSGVDRLALSCLMDIDSKGNVISHEICESVINVNKRCDYTNVNKVINGEYVDGYEEVKDMLCSMKVLAELLREKRMLRGSIDFDFPESKIIVNEKHYPVEIKAYERNDATRLIEDFMLIANENVAEDYFWQDLPFVYRSHENPDKDKMTSLGIFINNFGYTIHFNKDEVHPKELQKLLNKISGTEEESLISRLTLRSLKQAKYTTSCDGHFGLAAKYYCHFTSPIRRYPDLQIHRIIKENLHGNLTEKRINHYNSILPEVALQSSRTERRADEAEREVEKLKKVEYMSKFIGQEFKAVISKVTSRGLFVELPNTVEGFINIYDLFDDYYYFNEAQYMLVGEHTGKCYKLGQKLNVYLTATDKLLRTIDFRIVSE